MIVSAENAIAISQKFELYWSGKWQDDAAEMFKEIGFFRINCRGNGVSLCGVSGNKKTSIA